MRSHVKWRKQQKKLRRKYIRTRKAQERDRRLEEENKKRFSSPTYLTWIAEQEALEDFRKQQEELLFKESYKKWLEEEANAQKLWKEKQKKLELIRAEKLKQELLIREEWEREQRILLEKKEKEKRKKKEEEKRQAESLEQFENYVTGISDELPESSKVKYETNPGEPVCPFFSKVGACRFKDNCSRNHIRPGVSKTLLIPKFFCHFGLDSHIGNEYDTDIALEYEDSDKYEAFLEFYNDVIEELKLFGEIRQFKVCANVEPHLKGNVYVQYSSERDAIKAYRALHGRYYGGKPIYPEFCNIPYWSKAICGLFKKRRCPKGNECNFLHVFRNPQSEYTAYDYDFPAEHVRSKEETSWNWSPSPERVNSSAINFYKSDGSSKSSSIRGLHQRECHEKRQRSHRDYLRKDKRNRDIDVDDYSRNEKSRKSAGHRSRSNSSSCRKRKFHYSISKHSGDNKRYKRNRIRRNSRSSESSVSSNSTKDHNFEKYADQRLSTDRNTENNKKADDWSNNERKSREPKNYNSKKKQSVQYSDRSSEEKSSRKKEKIDKNSKSNIDRKKICDTK